MGPASIIGEQINFPVFSEWQNSISIDFRGDTEMDRSVLGTGSLILNKAAAALNIASIGSGTVPGYSNGGFVTQNGLGLIEPTRRYLMLNWALPSGSPADFPVVLTYQGNAGGTSEYGFNWVRTIIGS